MKYNEEVKIQVDDRKQVEMNQRQWKMRLACMLNVSVYKEKHGIIDFVSVYIHAIAKNYFCRLSCLCLLSAGI